MLHGREHYNTLLRIAHREAKCAVDFRGYWVFPETTNNLYLRPI